MNLTVPLIIASILAFAAFLIWNRTRASLERRRLQFDAQARMLERIGPGQALTEFLQTDAGKRFFSELTSDAPPRKDVRTRIFVLTTLGLIALFAGFIFVNAALLPTLLSEEPSIPADIIALTALPAFLLTGGGVGALVAAWLMHRLSRKWGMLEARDPRETPI
jgi:hypothetical protein